MVEFVLLFVSLVSVVNPFSTIPTFGGLTADMPTAMKRSTIRRTSIAVFAILGGSYLAGEGLLRFFSIGVPSLRVAGGLVILSMAWSMLHARLSAANQTQEEMDESTERTAIAIVPLAMPLLAGPGAISLMIIIAGQTSGLINHAFVLLAALLVSATVGSVLLAASPITRGLGKTGMNVVTRFMGLILLATAVEFITSGLSEIFPGLTAGLGG